MLTIKELTNTEEKRTVVETIVAALPEWFGEGTTISTVEASVGTFEHVPFFVACEGDEVLGFLSLKLHTPCAAEIGMMAVLGTAHGKGIGRKLVSHCEAICRAHNKEFLTVKTVDESSTDNDSFESTRAFYRALGFKPIEVFPQFWGDEKYPCLYSIKCLTEGDR